MGISRAGGPLVHPSIVVDASVWASILMAQDSNHIASLNWWQIYTSAGGILLAPQLLLVEVSAAIARQTKQESLARQAVSYIPTSRRMQLISDDILILDAAALAAQLSLKGADAMYVAAAHQKAVPLVSWDREQLSRSTVLPAQFSPDSFPF